MTNISNRKIFTSLIWKFLERGGAQAIQFVVQIILARLLLPEDYGLLAIITVFIVLSNVFITSGFSTALIQKKNVDEDSYSSVFYISLLVAIVLYVILFFFSPWLASFYDEPSLILGLRVLAITLFIGVYNSIQNAIVSRELLFKKLFLSTLIAIVISGVIGIYVAYLGYGIWALIIQQILYKLINTTILFFVIKWRPKLVFSIRKVKDLFTFGWKLLVSTLIDTMDRNLRSLVIGKIYNSSSLGFHNRGRQFPELLISSVNGTIQSVMLPVFSSEQDNKIRIKEMMRRSIVTSTFVIFPMMIGLAIIAEPLVLLLLTDKWLPAVPFMQIYSISFALWPMHTTNLQAINAMGRSDVFLKLEIIKKTISLCILFVSIQYGIYAIAFGSVISGIFSSFINTYPNKKLLNYSFKEQWKDVLPTLGISLIMGLSVYSIRYLNMSSFLTLALQIFSGGIVYLALAFVFKLESFIYLKNTVIDMVSKKE